MDDLKYFGVHNLLAQILKNQKAAYTSPFKRITLKPTETVDL